MRMVDIHCLECGEIGERLSRLSEPLTCGTCGSWHIERVYLPSRPHTRGDDIPGGILMHNGICNEDGTPKRYYSHSEIRAACRARGVIPYHDVYTEGGNRTLSDARQYVDYLKSSDGQRAKRLRDEERRERRR